jgi:ribosomal protein S18 acetylase RimI-like enzyme
MAVLENVTIRTATMDDLIALDRHPPIDGLLTCEHEALLTEPEVQLWIAIVDSAICGHAYVRWTGFQTKKFTEVFPVIAVMNGLAVWPEEHRNAGIGSALLRTIEKAVADNGFDCIGLGIYADNDAARRFYERLGYEDWGRGPIADRTGSIAPGVVALTKPLK